MQPGPPTSVLLALVAVMAGPVTASAQESERCEIYAAVLAQVAPLGSSRPVVVYDSVSMAIPSFAFHAWTGIGMPRTESKVPLTPALWEELRGTYRGERESLPSCFGEGRTVIRVPYDSLTGPFADRENGWDNFQRVFPEASGFMIVGRPWMLDGEVPGALLYIGRAVHWLSGTGRMFFLQRIDGKWTVVDSHALWMS